MTDVVTRDSYADYVLKELRLAHRRVRLLQAEIENIGTALKGGIIEPDAAIAWLNEAKALEFLRPTEPVAEETK